MNLFPETNIKLGSRGDRIFRLDVTSDSNEELRDTIQRMLSALIASEDIELCSLDMKICRAIRSSGGEKS
jgi:hypothetical protein